VSLKSRRVPGAMTDEELFSSCNDNETESEGIDDLLTDEERRQLEVALKMDSSDLSNENDEIKHEKKGWFGGWRKQDASEDKGKKRIVPPRGSLSVEEKVSSDLLGDSPSQGQNNPGRHSVEIDLRGDENPRGKHTKVSSSGNSESASRRKEGSRENEYKKGLRPVLWLSPDFPLRSEELLPLLDILANKVKAIRRLRELLTTKLPLGTFPVKVAIPVVPTIRVLVTFTKFEELQPVDEFSTPPSSPTGRESPAIMQSSSSSWFQWIKAPYQRPSSSTDGSINRIENIHDPFAIPPDYTWVTAEAKKKKMQEKRKSKGKKSESVV